MEQGLEELFAELHKLLELRAGKATGWSVRCNLSEPGACAECGPPFFYVCDEHGARLGGSTTLADALRVAIGDLRASARRMAQCL